LCKEILAKVKVHIISFYSASCIITKIWNYPVFFDTPNYPTDQLNDGAKKVISNEPFSILIVTRYPPSSLMRLVIHGFGRSIRVNPI
jgi:hypothetical protein